MAVDSRVRTLDTHTARTWPHWADHPPPSQGRLASRGDSSSCVTERPPLIRWSLCIVLLLFCLFAVASTALADCAWVAWLVTREGGREQWSIIGTFEAGSAGYAK